MKILGIETSCDETSIAVVENGIRVFSNVIATSRHAFETSGGVIPEDAARRQLESILPVLQQAMSEAKLRPRDIDLIAVTKGPGLLGSLLVGTTVARVLASVWNKPLIGVHHTFGHLTSTWLDSEPAPEFPLLTLSASGGHTDLWYRRNHTQGTLLGRTRDDAAGEAFDKGASLLGLPYPGGPSIAREALNGKADAFAFPRPLKEDETLDFSFSGLKTALKYTMRDLGDSALEHRSDLAASYQHAICAHLIDRVERAIDAHADINEVHIVGGVSANVYLKELAGKACGTTRIRTPALLSYCTDNAAMIAAAGYFLHRDSPDSAEEMFRTEASIPLEETLKS